MVKLELVIAKVVINDLREGRPALSGDVFFDAVKKALKARKTRYDKGEFSYSFAKVKEMEIEDKPIVYAEIAKTKPKETQRTLDYDAKDYKDHEGRDLVHDRWPFIICKDRSIVLRVRRRERFYDNFAEFFSQLYQRGGPQFTTAGIRFVERKESVYDIMAEMDRVYYVGLEDMVRANPAKIEDYSIYDDFLEKQGASKASTEFEQEDLGSPGLNIDRGGLIWSGLAGADDELGRWEISGTIGEDWAAIESVVRYFRVIVDTGDFTIDDIKEIARLMFRALKKWLEK